MDKVTGQCPQATTILKRKESRSGSLWRVHCFICWKLSTKTAKRSPLVLAVLVIATFRWIAKSIALSLVCFAAYDLLTTICYLAIVNVFVVIIILSIGNTQMSILLWFVFLTTFCYPAIVNVCVIIIILSIGNTQTSILLLCFLYLFVELMITMNE